MDEAAGLRGVQAASGLRLLVPAKTPRAIVARRNEAATQVMQMPETCARLLAQGSDPVGNSPQALATFLRADSDKNGAAVKQSGLSVE